MSPLRILILAGLVYLAFRLIFGGRRKDVQQEQKSTTPGGSGETPTNDTLVEDPVCGRLVPMGQAVSLNYQGQTHYFCSRECCDTFRTRQGESE